MNPPRSCVLFHHPARWIERKGICEYAEQLQSGVARGRAFVCMLADDRALRQLNRKFLNKNYATDVLSFPSEGENFLGEIAISLDRARAQAREYGHTPDEEIRILMLHGVLHLAGMDHESDSGEMARAERRWRRRFGLP